MFVLLSSTHAVADQPDQRTMTETIRKIEETLDGRIGVAILDRETGRKQLYNADARFPLNSTFKTLACGALLARVDAGNDSMDRRITFNDTDLVEYSPVTKTRTGAQGMSLLEICSAAMTHSDNTAANLVLGALGGTDMLTQFLRSIGDNISRLDRMEPQLNQAIPGDLRDTTTPAAMAASLETLVFGDILTAYSRKMLKDWLIGNKVSGALIRKAVPPNWKVGDRTGAGDFGSRSITAIIWPPERRPIIVVIYITETQASFDARNAAIVQIGAAIAEFIIE